MANNPQVFLTQVGIGKETTWGTSVARTMLLPVTEPRFNPQALRHIVDSAFRGLPSEDFEMVAGPGEGTFQWGGAVYPEAFAHMLGGVIGPDVYTTSHVWKVAAIPSSYTVEWATDTQAYLFSGGRFSQVTLNFNATDGACTYQAQGMGKLGATTTKTAPAQPATSEIAGWQTMVSNGQTLESVLEGSITFARTLKPIHAAISTAGVQDVRNIRPGPLKVTGRVVFEFAGTQSYANYLAAKADTANPFVLTLTHDGTISYVFTMSKLGWREGTIDVSDNIYTVPLSFTALHNATDAGPVAVVLNGVAGPAY